VISVIRVFMEVGRKVVVVVGVGVEVEVVK
jgi:hypothetical protein